jgi:hypothetical protein
MTATDAPTSSRPSRRLIVAHVAALAATVGSWVVLAAVYLMVSFGQSVCGDATPAQVAATRQTIREFWLLAAIVPFVAAVGFARRHRWSAAAWFAISVDLVIGGLLIAHGARPDVWCF